jgi:hypothetical protein
MSDGKRKILAWIQDRKVVILTAVIAFCAGFVLSQWILKNSIWAAILASLIAGFVLEKLRILERWFKPEHYVVDNTEGNSIEFSGRVSATATTILQIASLKASLIEGSTGSLTLRVIDAKAADAKNPE